MQIESNGGGHASLRTVLKSAVTLGSEQIAQSFGQVFQSMRADFRPEGGAIVLQGGQSEAEEPGSFIEEPQNDAARNFPRHTKAERFAADADPRQSQADSEAGSTHKPVPDPLVWRSEADHTSVNLSRRDPEAVGRSERPDLQKFSDSIGALHAAQLWRRTDELRQSTSEYGRLSDVRSLDPDRDKPRIMKPSRFPFADVKGAVRPSNSIAVQSEMRVSRVAFESPQDSVLLREEPVPQSVARKASVLVGGESLLRFGKDERLSASFPMLGKDGSLPTEERLVDAPELAETSPAGSKRSLPIAIKGADDRLHAEQVSSAVLQVVDVPQRAIGPDLRTIETKRPPLKEHAGTGSGVVDGKSEHTPREIHRPSTIENMPERSATGCREHLDNSRASDISRREHTRGKENWTVIPGAALRSPDPRQNPLSGNVGSLEASERDLETTLHRKIRSGDELQPAFQESGKQLSATSNDTLSILRPSSVSTTRSLLDRGRNAEVHIRNDQSITPVIRETAPIFSDKHRSHRGPAWAERPMSDASSLRRTPFPAAVPGDSTALPPSERAAERPNAKSQASANPETPIYNFRPPPREHLPPALSVKQDPAPTTPVRRKAETVRTPTSRESMLPLATDLASVDSNRAVALRKDKNLTAVVPMPREKPIAPEARAEPSVSRASNVRAVGKVSPRQFKDVRQSESQPNRFQVETLPGSGLQGGVNTLTKGIDREIRVEQRAGEALGSLRPVVAEERHRQVGETERLPRNAEGFVRTEPPASALRDNASDAPVQRMTDTDPKAPEQMNFHERIARFASVTEDRFQRLDPVAIRPADLPVTEASLADLRTRHGDDLRGAAPPVPAVPERRVPLNQFAAPSHLTEIQGGPVAEPAVISREPGSQGPPPASTSQAMVREIAQQMAPVLRTVPGEFTEITLRPDDLGRVQMRMSGQEGQILLQVVAERPETQDLMRRHIEIVERAFRDLGYTDIAFEFSTPGRQGRNSGAGAFSENRGVPPEADEGAAQPPPPVSQAAASTRLDIRV